MAAASCSLVLRPIALGVSEVVCPMGDFERRKSHRGSVRHLKSEPAGREDARFPLLTSLRWWSVPLACSEASLRQSASLLPRCSSPAHCFLTRTRGPRQLVSPDSRQRRWQRERPVAGKPLSSAEAGSGGGRLHPQPSTPASALLLATLPRHGHSTPVRRAAFSDGGGSGGGGSDNGSRRQPLWPPPPAPHLPPTERS